MPTQTMRFEGDLKPEQEKGYVYIPFEVPENTTRIEVEYTYSHQIDSDPLLSGGNTIDLGVFDARGIDFLKAGFRGWTGSERLAFFITANEATPGYLAGPLGAGRWHVLLGLYKIAPEGCHYRVGVTVTADSENGSREPAYTPKQELPAAPVAQRNGNWVRGEMHCHTIHSDGDSTPEMVVQRARARGLDFLAVTDHNSTSCQRVLESLSDPGLILIRGLEVTTFKGHFNIWGVRDWVDFRITCPEEMAAAIGYARDCGAVTVCNHPKPFGPPWDYGEVDSFDCIEVWNGPWQANNEASLDFWAERIAQGKRIVATGGSDWHDHAQLQKTPPRDLGIPTLWVNISEAPSAAAILNAIRQGHVTLSDAPEGPLVEFCAGSGATARGGDVLERDPKVPLEVQVRCLDGEGYVLSLLDQKGICWQREIMQPDEVIRLELDTASCLFLRAELRAKDGMMKAMTNPIYLESTF